MKNLNGYIKQLEVGMRDKLFFLKHLDISEYSLIVEFGCANGRLLRRIKPVVGENTLLIGFDNNEEIISIAKNISPNIMFTSNFEDCKKEVANATGKTMIIFSSVWHEIKPEFYDEIFKEMKLFDTIVIRDMKAPIRGAEPIDAPTRERIMKKVAPWQFEEFEAKWGRIDNKTKLYRFFLMYTYIDNWDVEINEDYFSTPWDEIAWNLEDEYNVVFSSSYTLESKRAEIQRVFDHPMHDITHHQVIYTRK